MCSQQTQSSAPLTQALAAAARLLGSVAQQSSRAGVAIASRLTDRCAELAAASASGPRASDAAVAAASLAGQRLDACLHFVAALAAPHGPAGRAEPPALAAGLLLCLPRLLPLARISRSSTRRLCLDLFSQLLQAAAQLPAPQRPAEGPQADGTQGTAAGSSSAYSSATCQSALLAALCAGLADRDATLRAKALACLERHASLVAEVLSESAGAAAAGGNSREGGGAGVGNALLQGLRGR